MVDQVSLTDGYEPLCGPAEPPAHISALIAEADSLLRQIAEIDLTEIPESLVADVTVKLTNLSQLAAAQSTRVARRFDTSMVWALDGSRSAAAALSRDTGLSWSSCRRMFNRGRHLESMPATAEAFDEGLISEDHVDLLVRLNISERHDAFVRDEAELVGWCMTMRHRPLNEKLRAWTHQIDAEAGFDGREPTFDQRSLRVGPGVGDEYLIEGFLDPVGGAVVKKAIDHVVAELAAADRADPDVEPRTLKQLRADALVELCRRGLAMPADAKKARIVVTVVTGDESFARLCELSTGHTIRPAALTPYIDAIDVNGVLFDGPTIAIAGSPQRCFRGMLRRVIEVRDRRCQHKSGCDEPMDGCDVDHVVPDSQSGPTTQDNGKLGCHYHNRIWQVRQMMRNRRPPPTGPPAPPWPDRPDRPLCLAGIHPIGTFSRTIIAEDPRECGTTRCTARSVRSTAEDLRECGDDPIRPVKGQSGHGRPPRVR